MNADKPRSLSSARTCARAAVRGVDVVVMGLEGAGAVGVLTPAAAAAAVAKGCCLRKTGRMAVLISEIER